MVELVPTKPMSKIYDLNFEINNFKNLMNMFDTNSAKLILGTTFPLLGVDDFISNNDNKYTPEEKVLRNKDSASQYIDDEIIG